jgi:hypothetical protein
MADDPALVDDAAVIADLRDRLRSLHELKSIENQRLTRDLKAARAEVDRLLRERAAQDEERAWVLTERTPSGKEHTEGIALTNEDATDFVRHNDEEGYARTSIPYKIYRKRAALAALQGEPS